MQAQLDRMAALAGHSKLTVQVIPGSFEQAELLGGFILADLDGKPPMAYLEAAAEGQVSDSPSVAVHVALRFDNPGLRTCRGRASRDLIGKWLSSTGHDQRHLAH